MPRRLRLVSDFEADAGLGAVICAIVRPLHRLEQFKFAKLS